MAGLALPLTPQNLSNKPLKLQSYPNAMQRQILVHAGVWLVSSKLNKAESWSWETVLQSTDPSSQHSRPGSFPHEGHTSSAGCTGRPDSASQFADGIPWMLGCWGTHGLSVPCPIVPMYSPDAALHHPRHCCSRSLWAVRGSMYCEGCQHCNQFQWLSFWFTFSTSFLRNLNCLFNPLALEQKHSALQPRIAGANLIPIKAEELPGIKTHMGTV